MFYKACWRWPRNTRATKSNKPATSPGEFRLRTIRRLIDRQGPVQKLMPFLEDHELIRPLSTYDDFVHESVQNNL